MLPEPSSNEPLATVLSLREQWRLLLWMEAHPRALEHDLSTPQAQRLCASRLGASGPGRAPLAYAVGLAVGMAWLLVRRWW